MAFLGIYAKAPDHMTGRRCCLYFIYQRNAGADREPDDQEAEGGKAAHKRAEAGAIERRAEHEAEGAQDYLGDRAELL